MPIFFAVCHKRLDGMGPDQDRTYVNVVAEVKSLGTQKYEEAFEGKTAEERTIEAENAAFAGLMAHARWGPMGDEFIVRITREQFYLMNSPDSLWHGGLRNLPKIQQRDAASGAPAEFGTFSNYGSIVSDWVRDGLIPDDRDVVRVYDADPHGLAAAAHIAREQLEQSDASIARRWLRLYSSDGSPSSLTKQDVPANFGGNLLLLDFVDGVASLDLDISSAGEIILQSTPKYRIVGPNEEHEVRWAVHGRTLSAR